MKWPILLCMLYLPCVAASNHTMADDANLKAALIYRFVQFTAWPEGQPDRLQYCILGDDAVFHAMQVILSDNDAQVSMLKPGETADTCDVLYIAANTAAKAEIPTISNGKTLLTIAENAYIFRQGMVIGFITEPKRLSFRVNLQAAKQQGLTLSSQMLKLAKEIY